MSTTAVTPGQGTEKTFDSAAYIKEQNERDQARREGKPVETKPDQAAVAETTAAAAAEPTVKLSRSERRAQNLLRENLGAERAKRELLEAELAALKAKLEGTATTKPAEATDDDPEPKREAFATDAEYNRAAGRWDARQEAKKELAKRDTVVASAEQLKQLRDDIAAADAKAAEDKKLIEDWDAVAAAAADDDEQPEFKAEDHPYLMRILATSDVKAFMLHHLAKNPKDMQKLLDLSGDLPKQTEMFRRLEGRVERLHTSEKPVDKKNEQKPAETKVAETAAERDARKAKPSEAATPRGGSAPANDISPVLADGKTLNPAWKEQQNLRAQGRR